MGRETRREETALTEALYSWKSSERSGSVVDERTCQSRSVLKAEEREHTPRHLQVTPHLVRPMLHMPLALCSPLFPDATCLCVLKVILNGYTH